MNERIKHKDKKNALSILQAAEREMIYTFKLSITEESSFNIIRNIYYTDISSSLIRKAKAVKHYLQVQILSGDQ